ncbi:uncharacterized protein [Dysidea avara]|uniref:uncharacterized protein isoform X2 n=1 Tax=Dysidea avara TaxID=196820 RepID=UPI00332E3AA1
MPSVAVQTNWSWREDLAKVSNYYKQLGVEETTWHLSVPPDFAEKLNEGFTVDDEDTLTNGSSDTGCDVNTVMSDGVTDSVDTSSCDVLPAVVSSQQQQQQQQQEQQQQRQQKRPPDHLSPQTLNTSTTIAVSPSSADATTPRIIKYPRESEEQSANVSDPVDPSDKDDQHILTCEFCGAEIDPDFVPVQRKRTHHDGSDSSDSEDDDDSGGYCCRDYKLFIELTTSYMQQMIKALQTEQAKQIDVKPGKKLMKKAAEVQAQARVRSKRLHRRAMISESGKLIDPIKILQSASFFTLSKQMKTINFSLQSSKNPSWVVRVSSGRYQRPAPQQVTHQRRRRRDKASVQRVDSQLPTIIFRDTVKEVADRIVPIVKTYTNGKIFQVILPDGTGHCRYLSGKLAVVATTVYPGLKSFILFEDEPAGGLLGYFDEAGRAYTFYKDHTFKLLFSHSVGKLFEPGGKVRKRWKWRELQASSVMDIQLSQQFNLKITNQHEMVLTFRCLSLHAKYSVGCNVTQPITAPLIQPEVNSIEQYYKKTKAEISFLLQCLTDTCQQARKGHSTTPLVLPPIVRTTKPKASTSKHVMF